MKQFFGILDLKTCQYIDQSEGIYKYVNDECAIYVIGKIKMRQTNVDGEMIWNSYQKYGTKITSQLNGLYILAICDKKRNVMYIFQDRTTSPLTLYYTVINNKAYLGTSLKRVLKESKIERKFNESSIETFLVNGFIYGKDTLVENVYKIESFTCLMFGENKIETIPVEYCVDELCAGDALSNWEQVLSRSITQCFIGKNEINMPLSSGFDSNYIAYVASLMGDKPINAYCVGGKFGKNEIPFVEENIAAYRDVRLKSALTDEYTLHNFPDIVWRLEGAVFEVGVFLQYELANLVWKDGKQELICGECADQVMHLFYLDEERVGLSNKENKPTHYEFSEYPYIFGSSLILKKNGILANSFGIETEYPYLDEDFVSIAYALRKINREDKRIHTAICREKLPSIVVKNMSKIGGSTDFHSLFSNKDEMNKFFLHVESSAFYQKKESTLKKASIIEKERQTGYLRIKTLIRNLVMNMLHLNETGRKQDKYYFEEIKMKEYMSYAYLILFDKLFMSGEFDEKIDCVGINIDIYDLI